jgi:hypothetical protein
MRVVDRPDAHDILWATLYFRSGCDFESLPLRRQDHGIPVISVMQGANLDFVAIVVQSLEKNVTFGGAMSS